MSIFLSLNADSEGDYYNGMLTDRLGYDDVLADFAKLEDPLESLNRTLTMIDETYKVSGASSNAKLNSGFKANRLQKRTRIRKSIRSYEEQENQRNFKPLVKRKLKLH